MAENLITFNIDNNTLQNEYSSENNETFLAFSDASSRYSLDNNPFDRALKQVALMSDPLESVFLEAECFSDKPQQEVKTDKLLSISGDDEALSGESRSVQDLLIVPTFSRMTSIPSSGSAALSSVSSINSTQCSLSNLDSIVDLTTSSTDKPAKLNTAFVEGTTENEANLEFAESIDESNNSILNKGFVNNTDSDRLQNSSNASAQCDSSLKDVSAQNSSSNTLKKFKTKKEAPNLLKFSLVNNNSSPRLNESDGSGSFGESLRKEARRLAVELSNMDQGKSTGDDSCCEDLMSIKPPNWIDSEGELDSDLELLKIPFLDQNQAEERLPQIVAESPLEETGTQSKDNASVQVRKSFDLAALKERIGQEKLKNSSADVGDIIDSLKKIVLDCSNEEKKAEANDLLEKLGTVLTDKPQEDVTLLVPPQPIIRQGTFDLDRSASNDENHNTSPQENLRIAQLEEEEEDDVFISPDIQKTLPEIVEQIGKLFGNENVNVVQTNLSSSSTGSNPTYIVVMGTPVVSSKKGLNCFNEQGDGSPELTSSQMRRRSQSLSLADKSALLKHSASASSRKTPLNTGSARRNSFSSALKGPGLQSVRRSIYGPISKNIDTAANQKCLPPTAEVKMPSKPFKQVNPELIKKKIRTKSNESVYPKPRGPLKATVPVKKMAPMVITPSVSSPIEEKQKLKPITSTPIVIAPKTKGFPNACSTPTLQVSPVKGIGKNRMRYSYMSTTPNPKMRTNTHQRRRSLTELKSPRKGLESVKETGIAKSQVRAIKVPQNFARKTGLWQKRGSVVDNKENNIPNAAK